MTSSINYKFSSMTKTLATDITFTWFLSGMNSLMNCKVRAGTEDSSTKLHFYAFSPIGTAWWWVKADCAIKRLSQLLHLSGFSPVWILPWTTQLEVWLKSFPHTHLQFLPSMISLMNCKLCRLIKALATQNVAMSEFSPVEAAVHGLLTAVPSLVLERRL